MIHRPYFYEVIRSSPFGGTMRQSQVDGCEILLDYPCPDDRHRGYVLATAFHETAATMEPIEERGPPSYFAKYEPGTRLGRMLGNTQKGDGIRFKGRGYAQITGRRNYGVATDKLGHDFLAMPEDVMIPEYARAIIYMGMDEGWFTTRRLNQYITTVKTDFKNARRVVNGVDRAALIAGYAVKFLNAVTHTPEPRG